MRQKYFSSILLLLLIALSITLINCKKSGNDDDAPPAPPIPPVANADSTLNKNVVIIDSTKLILISDTSLLTLGHLEYNVIGTAPIIKVNDIIVGATHGGYIKKVSSISHQQNKMTIESSQGTMEDVFNNAQFNFNTTMDSLKEGRVMSGYQFNLSNINLYKEGGLSLVLEKGVIDIDGNWNFGFRFRNAKLDFFELSNKTAKFNGQFKLKIEATQALNVGEHSSTLGRIAKTNVIVVGGVPVVVYTEVELRCLFSGTTTINLKRNIQVNTANTANITLKYDNSQWQNSFGNTSSSTIEFGEKQGNIKSEFKLAIVPYISFRLYRIFGPYASVGLQELIKGNTATAPSSDWDFYAGAWIRTRIGASARILGRSLLDYHKDWNTDTITYQTPYTIERTSGDNQTGGANQYLNQPLRVRVLDQKGASQSGVPVSFVVTAGGGSVETLSVLTDADGYAQTRWRIGSQNIIQTVEAKVKRTDGSLINGAPLEFAAVVNASSLPTITTAGISSITESSAKSGGTLTSEGATPLTARGVCWSTSQNPTIANFVAPAAVGTGSFTSDLTGLTAGIKYYVRAYATNSNGTAYGNEESFTTSANPFASLAGKYTGTTTWTNYEGNGADVSNFFSFSIAVDPNGVLSGTMTIDFHTGVAVGTANASGISIEWTAPNAPFKYTGTFSADKKEITGSGGAGGYYAPLNANGPFKVVKVQ